MTSFLGGGSQHFWDTILSFSFSMTLSSVRIFGEDLTRYMGSWCLRKQSILCFMQHFLLSVCELERLEIEIGKERERERERMEGTICMLYYYM